jgi:hypothetical protein
VENVRAISRRPLAIRAPKLQVIEHQDYRDYTAIVSAFQSVDACFYCLGKSATQVSGEVEYRVLTRDLALAAARALRAASPAAVFHFVSGQGAALDSRMMWARVKAETERELLAGFDAVCWRPAAIDGAMSPSSPAAYRYARLLYPLLRPFRSLYVSAEDLGRAMLQATTENLRGCVVENPAIRDLADRSATQHAGRTP